MGNSQRRCAICNKIFYRNQQTCSTSCKNKLLAIRSRKPVDVLTGDWNLLHQFCMTGKPFTYGDYRYRVSLGYYTSYDGNIKLHRKVWEEYHNRRIPPKHIIHHINGEKLDNRPENLELIEWGQHTIDHRSTRTKEEDNKIIQLYAETRSAILVAERLGRSQGFILAVLHEYEIPIISLRGQAAKENRRKYARTP